MLSSKGFDLWADDYDKSVGLSDEYGTYPFAGYKEVLGAIYQQILSDSRKKVLDIGFGTGTLTSRLYEQGCHIWGQDFSPKMMELAGRKMPDAKLYQMDFSLGLAPELKQQRYDAIIATYSLHHVTDEQKICLLQELLTLLHPKGRIYIGDVAFETRSDLEACRAQAGDEWDDEEIYCVFEELRPHFPNMRFTPYSQCAGLIEIWA